MSASTQCQMHSLVSPRDWACTYSQTIVVSPPLYGWITRTWLAARAAVAQRAAQQAARPRNIMLIKTAKKERKECLDRQVPTETGCRQTLSLKCSMRRIGIPSLRDLAMLNALRHGPGWPPVASRSRCSLAISRDLHTRQKAMQREIPMPRMHLDVVDGPASWDGPALPSSSLSPQRQSPGPWASDPWIRAERLMGPTFLGLSIAWPSSKGPNQGVRSRLEPECHPWEHSPARHMAARSATMGGLQMPSIVFSAVPTARGSGLGSLERGAALGG